MQREERNGNINYLTGNLEERPIFFQLKIVYADSKTEKYCSDLKAAAGLFGGNKALAVSLMARINAIDSAETLLDIVRMPNLHFHALSNKKGKNLKGYYAIDVKSRKDAWRIVLQPLDEKENPYRDTSIDQIAGIVRIVEITEVSNHYE